MVCLDCLHLPLLVNPNCPTATIHSAHTRTCVRRPLPPRCPFGFIPSWMHTTKHQQTANAPIHPSTQCTHPPNHNPSNASAHQPHQQPPPTFGPSAPMLTLTHSHTSQPQVRRHHLLGDGVVAAAHRREGVERQLLALGAAATEQGAVQRPAWRAGLACGFRLGVCANFRGWAWCGFGGFVHLLGWRERGLGAMERDHQDCTGPCTARQRHARACWHHRPSGSLPPALLSSRLSVLAPPPASPSRPPSRPTAATSLT